MAPVKWGRAIVECLRCGFQPRSPEEKAKSVILSTYYEIDGDYRGETPEALRDIGALLERGAYAFDPGEVRAVAESGEAVAATSARQLVIDGIRWLGPPLLFLAALLTLAWLARQGA